MKSTLLWIHLKLLVFILIGFTSTNTYSQGNCNNDLQLTYKIKSQIENSIEVKIMTSSKFTCTIFQIVNGEYLELNEKTGSGESLFKFDSLDPSGVFKVVAEFENETMFCRLRQIGGISL